MKVLMLCVEFPPVNTTGNFRSAGFARYLLKTEVKPIVFTAEEESAILAFNKNKDLSLLKGLEELPIYRFPIKKIPKLNSNKYYNYLRIWFNITDSIGRRWYYGENKKRIDSLIQKENPDVLYVSLPPFGMAKVAIKLSKKFNIPLVTDMRDAWSLWCSSPYSTRLHYKVVKRLEHKLFNASKKVISTSEEMTSDFIDLHKTVNKDKFKTIYNGYDKFEDTLINSNLDSSVFKIGYVGGFYYHPKIENLMIKKWYKRRGLKALYYSPRKEYWKYRSPYYFLKTLRELLNKYPDLEGRIKFEYIGKAPLWLDDMLIEFNLKNNFVDHGFLPKNEVLRIQGAWNAILATSEKVEEGFHYTIPSKSFDSIKLKKQILAFVTPGSQYNFLKKYKQVVFFDPDDTKENVEVLQSVITEKSDIHFDVLSEEFTREKQAEKLLELMQFVCNE